MGFHWFKQHIWGYTGNFFRGYQWKSTVLDLVVLHRSNSSMVPAKMAWVMDVSSPKNIVIIGFDPFKQINIRCWVSLQMSQIPKVQWFHHCHHVPAFKLALNLGFYILDTPIISYFGVSKRVLIGSFFTTFLKILTNLWQILRQPS